MKVRRALTAVAITSGLILGVSACGGEDKGGEDKTSSESSPAKDDKQSKEKEEPEAPAEEKVLAEVTGGDNITLTVNSAVRDQGGFLTVTGKVKNGSGKAWNPGNWRGDEKELQKNAHSMAGASVVDKAGKKRYLVLRDTEGRCLCTKFPAFMSDDEKTFFAQFPAPPESATTVDFQIADMPPASIEISEGE
ncbi:hypothetical protein G6045_37215 [Streptomyces sp. YC504]|uniref:DUF4352 domain-containing protein n=1 Tax=Streptomyces mesophilus TaxID=1775132 RepID=A0A6G4XX46_9ACTN|nr:hypothetical protein [Streptomyces mesophilus]NGO81264.1 hypothetical protein [Streptomyces mesophilus]